MKYVLSVYSLLVSACLFAQTEQNSPNYYHLWELIGLQEFQQAEKLITSGKVESEFNNDAYITGLYLKTYLERIDESTDFVEAFYTKNQSPDPYVFALWFTNPVIGKYGKKTKPHQIALIKALLDNPNAVGSLQAAAHYQYGMHYQFQNISDSARMQLEQIGGIQNWQYVGPFENLSNSGIFKNYGPLEKPDGKSEFTSLTNAKIKWFTPAYENHDSWIPLSNQIEAYTAVGYTQTFITSSIDQEIFCNVGATGAVRVWINDALILSETSERITELDTYTVKCKLNKGVNRILVQLSYTDSSYPNFEMRLTDEKFQPIKGLKGSSEYKPYNKTTQSPTVIKHFAEDFFQKKIQDQPKNMVNYLLLADVYMRSRKTIEARNLIESALRISENNLLRSKLIEILQKEDNETVLLEEVDKIRRSDPKASLIMEIDIRNMVNTEKYTDALELLAEYEKLYGVKFKTQQIRLGILGKQNNLTELVNLAEEMFLKYPDDDKLIQLMYIIQKEVYRDKEAGMKIYENFLAKNYNYNVFTQYLKLLHQEGKDDLVAEKRKWLIDKFPHETSLVLDKAQYHIVAKEYDQAEEYLKKALSLSPYHQTAWDLLGDVKREQSRKEEAINAYQRSLQYDPNQYRVITKLRNLSGKEEIYKIIPQVNIDEVIAKDTPPDVELTSDQGYYIILDDRSFVMHKGGALEQYSTYIVRITNEKGIEEFKESRIGYSSNQTLYIEQFDLIKKSGTHIQGERKENQIVFTNLEVGDVIVYRYRYQNYYTGRFANDYWGKHFFQSEAYLAHSRYSILLPPAMKLNYVVTNSKLNPSIKIVEDFKQYSWEVTKQIPYKNESYIPPLVDVLPVLHLSTVNSWSDISTWYADLINKSSDETFELTAAFENIFSDKNITSLTEFERAKYIYHYIQENIRYSSVSFRQSAYLPQTASKTIATRLGDCKDLSNLFMKLCDMAGIQARMVLTDTRENGQFDMALPSLDFNHCIAKAILEGKEYFIELTDYQLPFTAMPNSLMGSLILEIPSKSHSGTNSAELKTLYSSSKLLDVAKADVTLIPFQNDLIVEITRTKFGHLTTSIRRDFSRLPYSKQLIKLEDYVLSTNKNISIDTVFFTNLETAEDSVSFSYRYTIKDELAEIGSLKTFKIIFPDIVATSNHFSSPTREYPVDYVAYEDVDSYETTIHVKIPQGKTLLEIPKNVSFAFGGMTYDLQYSLVKPELLLVSRKFRSNRKRINANDYTLLKSFLDSIVKAEQRLIAFQ